MKKIKNEKTNITENKLKFEGDKTKTLDYRHLIEHTLDIVPQGGFTPADIRERNRIQNSLDGDVEKDLSFEDADYQALVKIVGLSRWSIRESDLVKFLERIK